MFKGQRQAWLSPPCLRPEQEEVCGDETQRRHQGSGQTRRAPPPAAPLRGRPLLDPGAGQTQGRAEEGGERAAAEARAFPTADGETGASWSGRASLVGRAGGAFSLAAAAQLGGPDLADVLGGCPDSPLCPAG